MIISSLISVFWISKLGACKLLLMFFVLYSSSGFSMYHHLSNRDQDVCYEEDCVYDDFENNNISIRIHQIKSFG